MSLLLNVGNTRISYRRNKKTVFLKQEDFWKKTVIRPKEDVFVCSVVPHFTKRLKTKYGRQIHVIRRSDIALKIKYGSGCGMDRLVNAVGAVDLFPQTNLVVVDMGTAITVDFIKKEPLFLGGWISAGSRLQSESLAEKTGQLFKVKFSKTDLKKRLGQSTRDSLALGQIKMLEGLLKQATLDAAQIFKTKTFKVILTGGDALIFKGAAYHYVSDLSLRGLACLRSQKGR